MLADLRLGLRSDLPSRIPPRDSYGRTDGLTYGDRISLKEIKVLAVLAHARAENYGGRCSRCHPLRSEAS